MTPAPFQEPEVALRVAVRCGAPETTGAAVSIGGDAITVADAGLAALALPSGLAAVTISRSDVALVRRLDGVDDAGGAGDVRPRGAVVGRALPLQGEGVAGAAHAPVVEESVLPRWAMPRIVGRLLLAGGEVPTVAVGFEGALTVASGLETVTRMRMIAPSSPTPSV